MERFSSQTFMRSGDGLLSCPARAVAVSAPHKILCFIPVKVQTIRQNWGGIRVWLRKESRSSARITIGQQSKADLNRGPEPRLPRGRYKMIGKPLPRYEKGAPVDRKERVRTFLMMKRCLDCSHEGKTSETRSVSLGRFTRRSTTPARHPWTACSIPRGTIFRDMHRSLPPGTSESRGGRRSPAGAARRLARFRRSVSHWVAKV